MKTLAQIADYLSGEIQKEPVHDAVISASSEKENQRP